MPVTRPLSRSADTLAGDFAVIARIEASLSRETRVGGTPSKPDFSRLRRYLPDLKI